MRSLMKLLALSLAILMVVAACSASDMSETFTEIGSSLDGDGGGDSGEATVTSGGDSASEEPVENDSKDELGAGGVAPVALPIDFGRDIIFTAELIVAVGDVADAGNQATRTIQSFGGLLFGQQTVGDPQPSSILTFKVAPDRFQDALDALGSIGEVRSQSVNAKDVTERIVDLESRIATASASVDRLRGLLAEATDIKAVVELESELVTRETELETLRGSLRTLEDQVALATIVLSLTQAESAPGFAVTVTAYPGHDEGVSCPGDGAAVVETATPATVCYEILNVGDTWLADFEMRDPVLDMSFDDLVVVFGEADTSLEPGDSLVVAAQVTPERDLRTRSTFTATVVDEGGQALSDRPVSQTDSIVINAEDPEGIASFGDGLAASWEILIRLGQVLVLALGALLPFVWIPIGVWLVLRYRKRAEPEV